MSAIQAVTNRGNGVFGGNRDESAIPQHRGSPKLNWDVAQTRIVGRRNLGEVRPDLVVEYMILKSAQGLLQGIYIEGRCALCPGGIEQQRQKGDMGRFGGFGS